MGAQEIESIAQYLDFLPAHPSELDRLFKDLLIAETSFFRDPLAFQTPISKRGRLFRRFGEGTCPPLDFIVRSLAPTDAAGIATIAHERIGVRAAREQAAEALRRMTRLHELSEQLVARRATRRPCSRT